MKWTWDTDRIVSLCAMVVGVGSLTIILYQTKVMREQQRASVMPYLAIVLRARQPRYSPCHAADARAKGPAGSPRRWHRPQPEDRVRR